MVVDKIYVAVHFGKLAAPSFSRFRNIGVNCKDDIKLTRIIKNTQNM